MSVAAVYFAQYIFVHGSLDSFFPNGLLDRFPGLYSFARWQSSDLDRFAVWLVFIAALLFGLLSALWRGERTPRPIRSPRSPVQPPLDARRTTTGWIALGIAAASTAGAVATRAAMGALAWLPICCWLLAVVAYVAAGWLLRPARQTRERPLASWPYLVLLVAGGVLLYGYRLVTLPARVDTLSAQAGLGAAQLVLDGPTGLMRVGALGVPQAAYLGVALWTWLTSDALTGVRLAGWYAGVLLVAATWLVGGELYRRCVRVGSYGETVEDDGRLMGFLAALVTAVGALALHFSRAPLLMEAAAWGTLGIWAQLFSLRRGALWLTAVSGLFVGLACFFSSIGLVFVLTAALTWIGIGLLRPVWLEPVDGGSGRALLWAALYWCGALALMLGPLGAAVLRDSSTAHAYWLSPLVVGTSSGTNHSAMLATAAGGAQLADNLRSLLGAFVATREASALSGFSTPLLHALLVPLFFLALGALAVNLDTAVGWILAFWLGSAWVAAGAGAPGAGNWPALLAGWPAVGLILAFGLDRLRVTILESFGTWMMQAAVYLVFGIVVGAGVLTWVNFSQSARLDGDAISSVARALHAAEADPEPTIVVNSGDGPIARRRPCCRVLDGQGNPGR